MKVGLVVEGQAEFKALPCIADQLRSLTRASSLRTLHANYDPLAEPGRVVKSCRSRIQQFAGRGYSLAIVLIDRENQTQTCAEIAGAMEAEFRKAKLDIPVRVVVKDRRFENWLVADLEAVRQLRSRFRVSKGMADQVEPNKADRSDAIQLLKRAAQGDSYGKVDDAQSILKKAQVDRMALHSRSFRCLLGRLGHPQFSAGSCAPGAQVPQLPVAS